MATFLSIRGVKRARSLLNPRLLADGMDRRQVRRALLRACALGCWCVALLGPALGDRIEERRGATRDVVLAVDVSRSMRTRDVAPDRLTRVREILAETMNTHRGVRFALVLFAADAWLRAPFTWDYDFLVSTLAAADPEDFHPQGTDLIRPLELALGLRELTPSKELTVVLVTDGEHLESGDLEKIAQTLKAGHVRLVVVGVGDPAGGLVPGPDGNPLVDAQGAPVRSRPDMEALRMLAERTGGVFVSVESGSAIGTVSKALNDVEWAAGERRSERQPIDRSAWPIGMGLALAALSLAPSWRRSVAATLALAAVTAGCRADHGAAQALAEERWEDAAHWYADRAAEHGEPQALANLGTALHGLQRYAEAASAYAAAAARDTDRERRAADLANAGSAAARAGQLEESVRLYEESLRLQDDADTRYNLELVRRLLQRLQQQQQQSSNRDDDSQEQQQQAEPRSGGSKTSPDPRETPQSEQLLARHSPGEVGKDTEEKKAMGVMLRRRIEKLDETPPWTGGDEADSARPW